MLVVKVELHSAVTGQVTELGRTYIWNDGTSKIRERGNYKAAVCRKGSYDPAAAIREGKALRYGEVKDYPRLSYNVWRLVSRALLSCFPEERKA